MTNTTYGYIRVSTRDQNEDRQRIALQEFGVPADCVYMDKQSGKAIALLRESMENTVRNNNERLKWARHFREFSTITELDRRSVVALVESIEVYGKTDIKINFRYKMEFDTALQFLHRESQTSRPEAEAVAVVPAFVMAREAV